jgi:hypothetical protein
MDTEAIVAAARQRKSEAERRNAEAIRANRPYLELWAAQHAADLSTTDIADPKKLIEKARAWQRLGKAVIACGLSKHIDHMPDGDGEVGIYRGFIKGLAKLICASKTSPKQIARHLGAIAEFQHNEQLILCQWSHNEFIPVLQRIEQDRANGEQKRVGALAPPVEAGKVPPGITRRMAARDHLWLAWYETTGTDTFHSPARIRDKWNRENQSSKIDDGDKGRDLVEKSIEKARGERERSGGK